MSKLLDTWAWIEYYEGSKIGEEVSGVIEEKCYTSIISLGELSDNFHRKDVITNYNWSQVENFVRKNSTVVGVDHEIMSEAGKIRAEKNQEYPDFGLIDAIILATARRKDLEILTGDKHLIGEERARNLESI